MKKIIIFLKNIMVILYKQFDVIIHIIITFILCYFCFLFSPTLLIAIIGCVLIIVSMFLLSMFIIP